MKPELIVRAPAKYPDEVLDYEIDFTPALGSDPIATVTVKADAAGGLVVLDKSAVTPKVFVRLSGGAPDREARVKLLATTTGGQKVGVNLIVPVDGR